MASIDPLPGPFRARDAEAQGISRVTLRRLVAKGELLSIGRGLYMRPEAPVTAHHSLALVAARVPAGVVNLLSALAFHQLTDELPGAVWLAIAQGSQAPRLDGHRLELTWTAPRFLTLGVERHVIEGVEVAITDPVRTVVDCFRFRSRVGLDVALAALRGLLAQRRDGRDAVWRMAGLCRVQTVVRPYLESLS
jgi:predicted transcriptional regulator of viral defense system